MFRFFLHPEIVSHFEQGSACQFFSDVDTSVKLTRNRPPLMERYWKNVVLLDIVNRLVRMNSNSSAKIFHWLELVTDCAIPLAWLQSAMCYVSMTSSISLDKLCKLMESFFQISNSFSNFLAENRNFFKLIARRECWSKCNVLYINDKLYKSWQALLINGKLFSNIEFVFELLDENRKIFNE